MISCPVCRVENEEAIFCKNCRYPLKVKKMDEFNDHDKSICLQALLEVIKEKKSQALIFNDNEEEELYHELFSVYWLRPETALFSFLEAKAIKRFRDKYLKSPLLDLGCGDGVFISIAFGTKINKKYDSFEDIDFTKTDPFNSYEKLPKDFVEKKGRRIDYGLDIKENSVKRARDLGIYNEVRIGDLRNIPFDDESIESVYCNMIDDIKSEDLVPVFREVWRILKKGGHFIFTTPTKNFREYLYFYNKAKEYAHIGDTENEQVALQYDRGRSQWEPRPLTFWEKFLPENSFEIIEYTDYGNRNLVQFWDTGFRPFFFDLIALKQSLKERESFISLKAATVEILKSYLGKFTAQQELGSGSFAMIVARK